MGTLTFEDIRDVSRKREELHHAMICFLSAVEEWNRPKNFSHDELSDLTMMELRAHDVIKSIDAYKAARYPAFRERGGYHEQA